MEGITQSVVIFSLVCLPAVVPFYWGVRKWIKVSRAARLYDPNTDDLEERRELARNRAISKAELERRLAAPPESDQEPA